MLDGQHIQELEEVYRIQGCGTRSPLLPDRTGDEFENHAVPNSVIEVRKRPEFNGIEPQSRRPGQ